MEFPNLPGGLDDWVYVTIALICAVAVLLLKFWNVPKDIKGINRKLERDNRRLDQNDRNWEKYKNEHGTLESKIDNIQLTQLRNDMFKNPASREQEEYQIEEGREYESQGGNGAGSVRLEWLESDYKHRMDTNDWDYTTAKRQ